MCVCVRDREREIERERLTKRFYGGRWIRRAGKGSGLGVASHLVSEARPLD